MKLIHSNLFLVLAFSSSTTFAVETTPLPSNSPQWSASSQMEIGRAKIVSLSQLPSAMRQVTQDQVTQRATGYESVPEEVFIHGRNYLPRLKSANEHRRIRVKLSDISLTGLDSFTYVGFLPEGPSKEGPWTSVTRVFQKIDGTILMLHEWDFAADGGGVLIVKEAMNTTVGGIPAQLSHKRAPSGQVLTELSWATKSKYFILSVWGDVRPRRIATSNSTTAQAQDLAIHQEDMSAIAAKLK